MSPRKETLISTHRFRTSSNPTLSAWNVAEATDPNVCDGTNCGKPIGAGETCYVFVDGDRTIRKTLCMRCADAAINETERQP